MRWEFIYTITIYIISCIYIYIYISSRSCSGWYDVITSCADALSSFFAWVRCRLHMKQSARTQTWTTCLIMTAPWFHHLRLQWRLRLLVLIPHAFAKAAPPHGLAHGPTSAASKRLPERHRGWRTYLMAFARWGKCARLIGQEERAMQHSGPWLPESKLATRRT